MGLLLLTSRENVVGVSLPLRPVPSAGSPWPWLLHRRRYSLFPRRGPPFSGQDVSRSDHMDTAAHSSRSGCMMVEGPAAGELVEQGWPRLAAY